MNYNTRLLVIPSCTVIPRGNRSRMKHVWYRLSSRRRGCAARLLRSRLCQFLFTLRKRFNYFLRACDICIGQEPIGGKEVQQYVH